MTKTKAQVAAHTKILKQKAAAAAAEEAAREEEEAELNRNKNNKKRKTNDEDDNEYEDDEEIDIDKIFDADIRKRITELDKREKYLKVKEKELKQKEEIKAEPSKKPRKNADEEEKVDVISIQSRVDAGRPNLELNGPFATAIIEDLIGFDDEFTKQDVSFNFMTRSECF